MNDQVRAATAMVLAHGNLVKAVERVVNEGLWEEKNGVSFRPAKARPVSKEALDELDKAARIARKSLAPWNIGL
jgi:hypothetical protein